MSTYVIEMMEPTDWPVVREIYQAGIETRMATFESQAPAEWAIWSASKRPDCRYVARSVLGEVGGWAALSPVSKRDAYRGVAEVSIYVAEKARGQGVGTALMGALVAGSEKAGIWTLTASIFPENIASVRLHETFGFKMLGRRERIAQLDGLWRDTVIMERRSKVVGC